MNVKNSYRQSMAGRQMQTEKMTGPPFRQGQIHQRSQDGIYREHVGTSVEKTNAPQGGKTGDPGFKSRRCDQFSDNGLRAFRHFAARPVTPIRSSLRDFLTSLRRLLSRAACLAGWHLPGSAPDGSRPCCGTRAATMMHPWSWIGCVFGWHLPWDADGGETVCLECGSTLRKPRIPDTPCRHCGHCDWGALHTGLKPIPVCRNCWRSQ